jgi:hypothetical protein
MANRNDARHLIRLRVNLTGMDGHGNLFKQTVFTHDVSMRGARVLEAPPLVNPASEVKLEYRGKKARFRVVWVGGMINTEVGLSSLEPSICIWGRPLPGRMIPASR